MKRWYMPRRDRATHRSCHATASAGDMVNRCSEATHSAKAGQVRAERGSHLHACRLLTALRDALARLFDESGAAVSDGRGSWWLANRTRSDDVAQSVDELEREGGAAGVHVRAEYLEHVVWQWIRAELCEGVGKDEGGGRHHGGGGALHCVVGGRRFGE